MPVSIFVRVAMPLKTGRAYAAYGKSFMRTKNYGSGKVAPPNFICPAIKNKPFELKIQGAMCKKKICRGRRGRARARWVPRTGAGRSKREREIFSPSASAEPIFPFHTFLAPPPNSRNLNINPAAPSGVRAHTRLFWRRPKSSNYR